MYVYVQNNPGKFIDPLGTDIILERSRFTRQFGLHQRLVVEHKGEKYGYSFQLGWEIYYIDIHKTRVYGHVYRDKNENTVEQERIKTSEVQNIQAIVYLENLVDKKKIYPIVNCRNFSQDGFYFFEKTI